MQAPTTAHEAPPATVDGQEYVAPRQTAPLTRAVTARRFMVLLAVGSVLLVAAMVTLLGAILTLLAVAHALQNAFTGELSSHGPVLSTINLVILFLEAVVFYLIGIGLYSLFIAPLPLATRLGLETLDKLESKMVSVIVVMISVTFLEQFVLGKSGAEVLLYAAAVAMVVPPLVWFKSHLH